MLNQDALLVIVGPTASGKTALALELADRLQGEIVSADSVQVYRYFDIGSGKPSADDRAKAAHHLIDIAEPTDPMDAAAWAARADAVISEIRQRGRVPIVCGGTFLWVKALLRGLSPAPRGDDALRAAHRALAEAEGRPAVHARLAQVDAESAKRLNPNDFVRVSRALEVFELSGKPMSQWQAEHGFRDARYAARLVGVERSPEELDARIRARAATMFDAGWADEVRALAARGFSATKPMAAVGYKQVLAAQDIEPPPTPEALLDEVVRATRVFARRQRTWLRDEPVHWLPAGELPTEI
jgi:tRNA dimethylallyltransferase